jgi:hypothetical protein
MPDVLLPRFTRITNESLRRLLGNLTPGEVSREETEEVALLALAHLRTVDRSWGRFKEALAGGMPAPEARLVLSDFAALVEDCLDVARALAGFGSSGDQPGAQGWGSELEGTRARLQQIGEEARDLLRRFSVPAPPVDQERLERGLAQAKGALGRVLGTRDG